MSAFVRSLLDTPTRTVGESIEAGVMIAAFVALAIVLCLVGVTIMQSLWAAVRSRR